MFAGGLSLAMESFQAEKFVENFVNSPSVDCLNVLIKSQLIEVGRHLGLGVKTSMRKAELVDEICAHYVDEGVLGKDKWDAVPAGVSKVALELKKLEIEEKRLEERRLERALEEKRLEMELEAKQLEGKLEEKRIDLEREKFLAGASRSGGSTSGSRWMEQLKLVPTFDERNVEQFFQCFERIAHDVGWEVEHWGFLVQGRLTGKAQRIYAALSDTEARDYEVLKKAVLRAYELVPEAYRQRFRNWRRSNAQSHVEFAKDQEVHFDKWCRAQEAETFEELRELVLLEQFKNCVSVEIRTFLDERNPQSFAEAARVADQYELTHKLSSETPNNKGVPKVVFREAMERKPGEQWGKEMSSRETQESSDLPRLAGTTNCAYCGKKGHYKRNCWALHGRPNERSTSKPIALATTHTDTTMNLHGATVPASFDRGRVLIDKGKEAFCTTALVGVNEAELQPVKTWRDTGAFQSLLKRGSIPLAEQTYLGKHILLNGVGGEVEVPLHQVYLKSSVVEGPAIVGVMEALPIKGVQLLIGNDLAGSDVGCIPRMSENPGPDEQDERSLGVVTRSMTAKASEEESGSNESEWGLRSLFEPSSLVVHTDTDFKVSRENLINDQASDPELVKLKEGALEEGEASVEPIFYYTKHGVLMRHFRPGDAAVDEMWKVRHQIVVPAKYRPRILGMAHEDPLGGHLGVNKTKLRITKNFFWPGLSRDVSRFCETCHVCQVIGKSQLTPPKAPLHPIPAFEEPFHRILIDCVGPLPKAKTGHQYLLTIMCSSTRFPEAIPLKSIKAKPVSDALIKFFTQFGLPREVQSDQGSNFTSKIFRQVSETLGIRHSFSSAMHPESQGALERFHQTLKAMLRAYCQDHQKDWPSGIPLLLFAVRESVQESLGFSPNELVFGHDVRGPLKLLKEKWLEESGRSEESLLEYASNLKEKLLDVTRLAADNLKVAQTHMKKWYDSKARTRNFETGEEVLVLLPSPNSPLSARYCGPYPILKKVGEVNYVVETPGRRKSRRLCHVNMLKRYYPRHVDESSEEKSRASKESLTQNHLPCAAVTPSGDTGSLELSSEPKDTITPPTKFPNSIILENLSEFLTHLEVSKREDVEVLINEFLDIFSDYPSVTDWAEHDIDVGEAIPIKQHPYRVNPTKKQAMNEEVKYMEEAGIIEESDSNWSSPCLLVPKTDGSYRFCTDYRKVNAVTVTDSFPLPRIEDCIDAVGPAKFISKFDLLKGYWQVPLTERAKRISAFVTPQGLWQYRRMAFGMKNAAATFQRLANKLIHNMGNCSVYLDDIVLFSSDWSEHVQQIRQLFGRIREAGLTVNLSKCEIAKAQVNYLGFEIGHGQVKTIASKVETILDMPPPASRADLRRFLGMVGYYRRFCQNYAEVVFPLTSLTSPKQKFQWTPECQRAFQQVKLMLSCPPVLVMPDFGLPFALTVDASGVGVGAVMSQRQIDGFDHPIAFFSKKLNKHQRNYSTYEKEALALVSSLQHFEVYLKSGQFPVKVFTDHSPLQFINKMKDKNQRILRWSLLLQEYDLVFTHIRGKDNFVADCLSRN